MTPRRAAVWGIWGLLAAYGILQAAAWSIGGLPPSPLVAVLATAADPGAQSGTFFWWQAAVDGAETVSSGQRPTFILHGRQDALNLAWIFKNDEGTDSIQIDPLAFREKIRVAAMEGVRPIDTVLVWAVAGKVSSAEGDTLAGALVRQDLQPGEWIEWHAAARRADGLAWDVGDYRLAIDMAAAVKSLTSTGKPFSGRAQSGGVITVRIVEGGSAAALKASHLRDGHKALAEARFRAAVESYRAVLRIDPNNRAARGLLGQALVAAGEYKDGAAALEIALPLALSGEKTAIPETLAYAYLALGDEKNAVRVLRLVVPESALTSRLERLRKALPKR